MQPFLVLYKLTDSAHLSVQAVGAPSAEIALQAVGESLVEQGQPESVLVGVFAKHDFDGMLKLFTDLEAQLKDLPQEA